MYGWFSKDFLKVKKSSNALMYRKDRLSNSVFLSP